MSDITLGKQPDSIGLRDAIHVAVIAMEAKQRLMPGQHVGMTADGVVSPFAKPYIGIVDPFLEEYVEAGETFWLMLYQNRVTGMRHHWYHPAFGDAPAPVVAVSKAEAEDWLWHWCTEQGHPYDCILEAISTGQSGDGEGTSYRLDGEDFMVCGGDASGEIPTKVYDCVEIITGKKVTERPSHFSCSC